MTVLVERIPCGDCRHYQVTGAERSGRLLPDRSDEWLYSVGTCSAVGTPHPATVQWGSCHLAHRKRAIRMEAQP